MPTKLVWRRCGTCGQLTLVPVSANVCWQCGAPLVEPPHESDPPSGADPLEGQADDAPAPIAWHPFAFTDHAGSRPEAPKSPDQAAIERNLPPAKPRAMDLTPDDDAIAHRLLESIFPDGLLL